MYSSVVAAIDLATRPARQVLEKAASIVSDGGKITVLHVVEPHYAQYSYDPTFTGSMVDTLEKESVSTAQRRLQELCAPFGIDEKDQVVLKGHTSSEIHDFVNANQCDLLVMATHGRRGWQRVLGSTVSAVLHGIKVDTYVCRIGENDQ